MQSERNSGVTVGKIYYACLLECFPSRAILPFPQLRTRSSRQWRIQAFG